MKTKQSLLLCLTLVGVSCWRYVACNNCDQTGEQNVENSSSQSECSDSSSAETKNCPRYYAIDSDEQLARRLQLSQSLESCHTKPAEPADSSLQQVLLVHRHGDRTPVDFPCKDELADEPLWSFFGSGQLTNRGKARVFLMGRIERDRYDRFLNGSVDKNHRISRSSGVLRCIESGQLFLASFLALDRKSASPDASKLVWDTCRDHNNQLATLWQPASIRSAPVSFDGMLADGSVCKNLDKEYDRINESPEVRQIFADYAFEASQLRELLGYKMTFFQEWFWASSLLEIELSYFADKVRPELAAIYKRVVEAGNKCLVAYQSSYTSRRLRSGLLAQNILEQVRAFAAAKPDRLPFVHYSTHDLELVSLLGVLGVYGEFGSRPDYASHVNIELHRDPTSGVWFVRLFYTQHVPSERVELQLPACKQDKLAAGHCRLDTFERLLAEYALGSWQSWMRECNNDFGQLDPYAAAG